ncbi:MAG TPA: PEP-CTERM sorting domain-containing protein [Pirellulales bacterium]|jgi:hypothetical protein|nr:PEP-CTERM sorting domain-containing protein [Pirellulales bacterium]
MSLSFHRFPALGGLIVLSLFACTTSALADSYTLGDTAGGHWNTDYVQGFNTSLIGPSGTAPSGLNNGDPVYLTQFQFFKSGNADSAANIQLAIINNIYSGSPTIPNMTESSGPFVGISTNTIASTASLATGDAITFTFNNLQLSYGTDYAAYFVNVGAGGALTPVLVSTLDANYADQGGGDFHPVPNYGTDSQFNYTTSNSISGGFFSAYSYAGDANFLATLSYTAAPEPSSIILALGGFGVLALAARRRVCR